MSMSRFSKAVVSLTLMLMMVNVGSIAYAAPGDVICTYQPEVALSPPAIGDDGTLYSTGGNALYAINPNCTLKWKYPASGSTLFGTPPIIADDGTIYFSCAAGFSAVNPDSTLKWTQQAVKGINNMNPVIGRDGIIYVGGVIGSDSKYLYAISPSDGSVQWQYPIDPTSSFNSPVIASDNTIYIGNANGVSAINPDGTLRWQYSAFSSKIIPAVGNDGTIYTGGSSATSNALYALTPSGTLKWQYDIPSLYSNGPVAIGSDGTVYYRALMGGALMYAMTPDGGLKWSANMNAAYLYAIAIGADNTIYDQDLQIFRAMNSGDGTSKWQINVDSFTFSFSAPAIATDGTIYFTNTLAGASGRTTFYAVESDASWTYTDYQNSMKGYADSPWPRFRQNNFNTGHRPKMPAGVSLPDVKSCDKSVSIPITLNNSAKVGIEGIDLTVTFDSSVIRPSATPATLTGGIYQSGYGHNYNKDVSGQIRLSIYASGTPSTASGIIAYLNFDVVGAVGSTTKLTFTQSLVNSVTSTRTDGSFTVNECAVSGNVVYYPPSTLSIPNAQVKLGTVPPIIVNTNSSGNYTINAPAGTYPLSVSKSDDLGGLSGTDVSDISRYMVGKVPFNCYQKIAADVNRDGQITSVDASRVARYLVGDPDMPCMNNSTPCIEWVFIPYPITDCTGWPPITYPTERTVTIPPSVTGQNFIGIRLGDVTGNWAAGAATRSLRDHELRENSATCNLNAVAGTLKMPIVLSQSTAIRGIDIVAEFDSSVLTATDVTLTGGILDGKGYTATFNTGVAGKVSATIYATGDDLFTGSGEVAYISFTVSKTQSTAITLKKFNINEAAASGGLKINGSVCQIPIPVVLPTCDPDFDGKFTMSDVIYYLQCIAGVRQDCICDENLGSVIQVLRVLAGM